MAFHQKPRVLAVLGAGVLLVAIGYAQGSEPRLRGTKTSTMAWSQTIRPNRSY